MAGEAFRLVIPQDMLNKLQTADEKLEKLVKTSQNTQSQVIAAFNAMADGVNPFIQKLNEAQQALGNIKAFKGGDIKLGNIATEATKSADAVNELVQVIAKLVQENKKLQEQQLSSRGITIAQEGTLSKKESSLNYKSLTNDVKELHNAEMERGRELTRQNSQNIANQRVIREQLKQETNAKIAEAKKASANIQILSKEEIAARKRASNERIANDNDASKRRIAQQKRETNEIIAELNRESRERIKEANRIARLTRLPSTIDATTAQNIISKSGSAVSINQMLTSIKNLEKAKRDLDTTDKNYKKTLAEIDNAINKNKQNLRRLGVETENVRKHQSNLMNHAQQLRRALALVFSVSQITGYINKMIQVRGEFELQQRSLQAILQNKDEADKLWQQTVDLAVRSPFRVKELVSYTKQLAAYRVETDKLHDTTKMLSDVSAGLGVDMQRLILAYGQVKAANYLRGTELRQFSEAGINILGELAKYFTELEGRAVSVGEVFERVSKRMVAFSDVEEIFKRVTSEGGVFYRMQEIQSETVKGLISNLYDQVDLMLNDIGKSNDGALKGAIGLVKEFVESWREVAWYLENAAISFAAYTAATKLAKLGTSGFTQALLGLGTGANGAAKGITFLRNAWLGLKSATIVGLITTAAFALLELYRNATKASREAERLQKELNEIYNADYTVFKQQTKTFNDLVEKLKNVNEGSQEHRDIIGKLNSQYGEHIGFIVTEATTYDKLKGSIDRVNEALMRKAKMNTYEKAYAKVMETSTKAIQEAQASITTDINESIVKQNGEVIKLTKEQYDDLFVILERRLKGFDKFNASKDFLDLLKRTFNEYGLDFEAKGIWSSSDFASYYKALLQQKEAELKLEQQINSTYNDTNAKTTAHRKALEEVNKREKERLETLEKQGNTSTYNYKKEVDRIKKEAQIERIKVNVEYEFPKATNEEKDSIIAQRISELNTLSATIIDVNNKIEKSVGKLGEKYTGLIYIDDAEAATGVSQIAENTAQAYRAQQEIIKQQNALKSAGTVYDKDVLDNAQKTAKAYYYKLELLGRLDLLQKQRSKEESKELQMLNKQLAALKEAKQTFDNLRQKFGLEESTRRTAKAFEDLFSELGMTQFTIDMSFDNQGIIDVIEKLPNKAGKAGEQALEKIKAELRGGLDVDIKVREDENLANQIADMFSGYELSLELQKLNIPPDLAKQLFNVDSLTLPELKTQLQGMESQFVGTDMEKEYRDALRKVDEMERKAQEERLKKYVAFSRKALSERAKIKLQELQTIEDIEKTFAIKQEDSEEIKATKRAERARALAQAQKEANDAIQKLDWEDFKSSDTFNNIFDDIEHASDEVLKSVIQRLKDFKDQWKDMPFEQMRQVVDLLNKAEGALNEKSNPFVEAKRLRGLIKADGRTTEQAQVDMFNAEQMKATKENELAVYELFEQVDAKLLSATSLTTEQQKEYVEWQNLSVKEQEKLVQGVKNEISAQQGVIDKANIQLNNVKKLKNAYEEQADAISKIDKMANDLYDSFKGLSEALGGDSDSPEAIFADMGMNMASTVMQTIVLQKELQAASVNATAFGAAMNAAMGVIGWIVMAVQLLTQAISAMVKAHDNNLENQIQDQIERVEELEHSYKKLEKAIAEAYSAKGILDATENAQKNLDYQISSYRAMIAAEEQKKNADNDRISEWERTIEELEEQREQLKKDMVESLGGSYDYRNVASDWASAWLDSFKETGNGLKGLQESFDEFIENLIVQQLAAKIAGKHAKNILDVVNYALEDGVIDELEADYINNAKEMGIKAANAEMEAFASLPWVQQWMDGSTSNLSGLTEGIKGITESTAQIIEAYLNSLRFFVSEESEKISNIERILTSNEETGNPILSELRAQTSLVREIREVLGDVVFVGHSKGGSGLKVFMD